MLRGQENRFHFEAVPDRGRLVLKPNSDFLGFLAEIFMLSGGKRESTLTQRESNSVGDRTSVAGPRQAPVAAEPAASLADESLVEKAAAGDGDAFELLVARYQDRVFNILLRICGKAEEAEDLAQETFLKAYRALGSFRQGSTFYTWLFRIATNTALSRRRQDVRRKSHEGLRLDSPGGPDEDGDKSLREIVADRRETDPGSNLEKEHVRQRVREGLEEIDPDYKAILILRDMEGLDYDAIAETLTITRAAVKSRLHRARQEMARILKDLSNE